MGGVSERMIRTARSASSGLLEDHSTAYLDDEALRTLPQKLKILWTPVPLPTITSIQSEPDAPEYIKSPEIVLLSPGTFLWSTQVKGGARTVQYLPD